MGSKKNGDQFIMKVLFISHFKEGTAWSRAAADYATAMASAGIEVCARNVLLQASTIEETIHKSTATPVPMKIQNMMSKDTKNTEACVQFVLPHLTSHTSMFKNVIITDIDSTKPESMTWFEHLRPADELWTVSAQAKEYFDRTSFSGKVRVVGKPFKPPKNTGEFSMPPELESAYKFYWIGGVETRFNLASVIKAFHSEFTSGEDVALILKPQHDLASPEQLHQHVSSLSDQIKTALRIYPHTSLYRREAIIPEALNRQGLDALHASCDCFVYTPHADSWGGEAASALYFGNTPILSAVGGALDVAGQSEPESSRLVGGSFSPCECADAPFPQMYTGSELWFSPDISEIRYNMRESYESRGKKPKKAQKLENISMESIGQNIREFLNAG